MPRDTSSHARRATTTRTHSPAYMHEQILASDGVPRDRDHLRAHGAAHGVDHLDEPYQLLSSVTAPTAPSAVRTHVVRYSIVGYLCCIGPLRSAAISHQLIAAADSDQ